MTKKQEDAEFAKALAEELVLRGVNGIPIRFPPGFWDDVYRRLPAELIKRWKPKSVAGIWKQRKDRLTHLITMRFQANGATENVKTGTGLLQPMMRRLEKLERGGAMNPQVRSYIDDRIEHQMSRVLLTADGPRLIRDEEPPMPPKVGKRELGSKTHISARADSNLAALFEQDARKRFHGNASRTLDWILWNFYGKPRLSFEQEAQTQGCSAQEEEPETVGEQ